LGYRGVDATLPESPACSPGQHDGRPHETPARPAEGLSSRRARLHISRTGIPKTRHGASVGRPRVVGTGG